MNRPRFWAFIATAILFVLIGLVLGELLPLPDPLSVNKSKLLYALVGLLLAIGFFSRISSFIVASTTKIVSQAINKLAQEIFEQISKTRTRIKESDNLTPLEEDLARLLNEAIIIDTSSLIDGRVLDVAKTGFLGGPVIIPDFVLRELQQVADSADDIKRARGRRGFEVVDSLKKIKDLHTEVFDRLVQGKNVDDQLINLAKVLKGKILTTDFNLNRVARLQGVKVLNLNDLSNALKTMPVPGEKLDIKVVHLGKDKGQGVGYLQDGTMVVVKDAAPSLGSDIAAEVTKIIQSPTGRIVFSKISS